MAYSDEFWRDIKSAFERGVSTKKLSKINGVSRAAISTRAQKEGWARPSAQDIERAVADDTMSRLAGVKGHNAAEDARAIEEVAEERVAIIRGHRAEWKNVERLRRLALRSATDANFVPEGWDPAVPFSPTARMAFAQKAAAVYRTVIEATTAKQEAERRAHGFDYKLQREQKREEQDDLAAALEFTKIMDEMAHRLTAPTPDVPRRGERETIL